MLAFVKCAVWLLHLFLSHCSPDELIFTGMKDSDILCTLTLTNITEDTIAYKVSALTFPDLQDLVPIF